MLSTMGRFLISLLFATAASAQTECPPFYVFTGELAQHRLGVSVASAGDVNGDGYDDMIVSAYSNGAGVPSIGRVYVFSGLNGDTLHIFNGERTEDMFGTSVASAGDVNNDGYADLIVGARGNDAGSPSAGRTYVFSGLNGDTLHIFNGEAISDWFGWSVASAGDVDGDGFADLIVGALFNDAGGNGAGRAYVFSGRTGDTLHVFTGDAGGDVFSSSVASAGDVNNDGYADLIVGAQNNDAGGPQAGRAYVFSGFNGDTLHVFTGEAAGDFFGVSVASAGDVNNDGNADLIVGAHLNDAGGNHAGRAYVFSGLDGDTLYVFTGEAAEDRFGGSVGSAGDINNDGYTDLIVGASFNDAAGRNAGRAYIFSGLTGDPLHILSGEAANDGFGKSVASAGDVNNDGYADLFIGAFFNGAGGDLAGRAYVYLGGGCGDVDGDGLAAQADLTFLVDFYFHSGGASVFCGSGDVNNDGKFDLSDIIFLSEYLEGIGPAPCSVSAPPPSFDPKENPQGHMTGPTGY